MTGSDFTGVGAKILADAAPSPTFSVHPSPCGRLGLWLGRYFDHNLEQHVLRFLDFSNPSPHPCEHSHGFYPPS